MDIKLTEAEKIRILNGEDVFSIMQKVLLREDKIEQDKEHFWLIGLNINNKVLFIELVSLGGVLSTVVEPVSVFRVAILKNAVKAILVHNHPSGDLAPSEDDKDITDRLMQVGRIIKVTVIDHLIISTEDFYSFVDMGLYAELQKSLKWVPPFEIIEKIRAEEQKIRQEAVQVAKEEGKEEGLRKGKIEGKEEQVIESAKNMLAEGFSLELIAKVNKVSVDELNRLLD